MFADLSTLITAKDSEGISKFQEKYRGEADRYKEEQRELEKEAHATENETTLARRKADRFDLGEVFLEIALVITSITLLSRRRIFWHFGLVLATAGLLVAASAWLLH